MPHCHRRITDTPRVFVLGAQTVTEAWVQSDANGNPYGSMIAMDSQENVVVTGWRLGDYIITKKYDPDGNLLWEQHFTVPDLQAVATWVLVDAFDNIVITGYPGHFPPIRWKWGF